MRIEQLYSAVLAMYPFDYRSQFAGEMQMTFAAAAAAPRDAGTLTYFEFLRAEFTSVAAAVVREWVLKLAADPVNRARALPDCRRMRPVGITRAEWAAGLDHAG